jgi:hypothetical protein
MITKTTNKSEGVPIILIDRNRTENHPYDYVVNLDKKIGFVGKIIHIPQKEVYIDFILNFEANENAEIYGAHTSFLEGGVVLQVEKFLCEIYSKEPLTFDEKMKERLKKAFKRTLNKYIYSGRVEPYDL